MSETLSERRDRERLLSARHRNALEAVVDTVLADASGTDGAVHRARVHAELLALLQAQVDHVTALRDHALAEIVQARPGASNRALAKELHLSRQRVDQLKRHLADGG